jgi:hypothetical protein
MRCRIFAEFASGALRAAARAAAFLSLPLAALVPAACSRGGPVPPPPPPAAPVEARLVRNLFPPDVLEACDRFKARSGKDRRAEGRIVFDRVFPKSNVIRRESGDLVVRADDQPYTMTREDVVSLLGPPNSGKSAEMTYVLGKGEGEDEYLQVFFKDGKVVLAITSLPEK